MENPIKMGWFGGKTPLFSETSIYYKEPSLPVSFSNYVSPGVTPLSQSSRPQTGESNTRKGTQAAASHKQAGKATKNDGAQKRIATWDLCVC